MALLSISVGVAFFAVAIIWFGFSAIFGQMENSGFAYSFILGMFPAFIGLVLIVPSTLYRTVFVFAQKPEQTLKEKVILSLGLFITLLCFSTLIKLIYT
ncbi:hypothetical protein P20652_0152 [Pseudoalteromonas sp. BSi20652]|uniref:hypothetical protein n=1 Tax=Pseudoalteromonas sp. BSi20652 TaxID=388384 RepID=UPI000231A092|nr:hypothetical protein [Pseudoalteromonas sp. BSi20652]GAA58301.1 hypothetical protein P20652_0152 [Pseudoalteromonas sp. BSi20652]